MPRRKAQTRPRAPKPLANGTALLERFKDFPAIDVVARRFMDPNDPGSLPILLKDEDIRSCVNSDHQYKMRSGDTVCRFCKAPTRKWYVRYFNLAEQGRNAQMRAKGYVPVDVKELQDADDVADLYRSKEDTCVRRGDRGQEILAKQPLELHLEIKRRRRAARDERARDVRKVQSDLAEAAGAELGDEAGTRIHAGDIRVESMTRSKTTLAEEADFDADA